MEVIYFDLFALNTHIQCPSFKVETNGSVPMPFKEGSGSPSGTGRLYFQILIHLHSGITLRFCHEGVVWQSSSSFGLSTTPRVFPGVTATCRGLHPFHVISLLVLQMAGYSNPISEELAKQAKPRTIGSLHSPRMRGKRGEVII